MEERERLDILVQRQLGVTRSKAQGLIQTGQVFSISGDRLDKPGLRLAVDTELVVREQARYVSRGGDKLEAAFREWPLDVAGKVCIDVGASTGGFTDCLLQHGAGKVYALDVGYGQLAWEIRSDPKVVVMERFNVRHLKTEHLAEPPAFFTADCSFVSLRLVLPPLVQVLAEYAQGVALIKPQFEAGRAQVGKGGVVRDENVRAQTVETVCDAARSLGFSEIDVIPSPLLGPAGNTEYLAWLRGFAVPGVGPDFPAHA